MAVPTERTWLFRDPLSTTNLNAGIRDPLTFLLELPSARLRQTSSQSLTSGAWAPLTYTTEDLDTNNAHSTVSNTSRYVSPEDGWYWCSGGASFATNATGNRGTRWAKNGTVIDGSQVMQPACSGVISSVAAITLLVSLSVGDYVEIEGFQSSGGALSTSVTAEAACSMNIQWARRL